MKPTISQTLFSVLGVLAALAAAELVLRPWASAWLENPPTRAVPTEVRQYYEGFASAHYATDGERLTGNPPVAGAPHVLILGDSHVEAMQVSDGETMGAVVELHARNAGAPINAHQYGWSYSAAPTYAQAAPRLLERWQPAATVVVLHSSDLEQAYFGAIRISTDQNHQDGIPKIIDERAQTPRTGWRYAVGRPVLANSTLAYQLYIAARMMEHTALNDALPRQRAQTSTPEAALASVRLLKAAYGARLLIVYDMYLHGLHTATVDDDGTVERSLMQACAEEGVRCVLTRAMFTHDRLVRTRFSRGFSNTPPGVGHWNQTGHALLGELIWQQLQTPVGRR
ncbi:MAG: hypothetical protein ABIP12_03425 [Terriglobales bacterium]